jgi:hypothetical protein
MVRKMEKPKSKNRTLKEQTGVSLSDILEAYDKYLNNEVPYQEVLALLDKARASELPLPKGRGFERSLSSPD